jgi:hypothetical protein
MDEFSRRVHRVMMPIFGLVGTAMILVSTYGVFARNVLQLSAPWTDEALKLLDICMIFIVSAVVFLRDEHIALTLIEDSVRVKSRPRVYGSMKIFQYLLALIIHVELVRELYAIIAKQVTTNEITTVMEYPLYLLNVAILIGCVLTVLFAVLKIMDQMQKMGTAPEDAAPADGGGSI